MAEQRYTPYLILRFWYLGIQSRYAHHCRTRDSGHGEPPTHIAGRHLLPASTLLDSPRRIYLKDPSSGGMLPNEVPCDVGWRGPAIGFSRCIAYLHANVFSSSSISEVGQTQRSTWRLDPTYAYSTHRSKLVLLHFGQYMTSCRSSSHDPVDLALWLGDLSIYSLPEAFIVRSRSPHRILHAACSHDGLLYCNQKRYKCPR